MDTVYTGEAYPTAYVLNLPSALMQKTLCLALCSLPSPTEEDFSGASLRHPLEEPFVAPSSKAIRWATSLLVRFATGPGAAHFFATLPGYQNDQRKEREAWRKRYLYDEGLESTPLARWARAIPLQFDTLWDLLAFQPNDELPTERAWTVPGAEFWMRGARERVGNDTPRPPTSWRSVRRRAPRYVATEAAWRVANAFVHISSCADEGTHVLTAALAWDGVLSTALAFLFSFPQQKANAPDTQLGLYERVATAARMYMVVRSEHLYSLTPTPPRAQHIRYSLTPPPTAWIA